MADETKLDKLLRKVVLNMNPQRSSEIIDADEILERLKETLNPDTYQQFLKQVQTKIEEESDEQRIHDLEKRDLFSCEFEILKRHNYGWASYILQNSYKNKKIPHQIILTKPDEKITARPLTFRENILVRVHDYETLKDDNGERRTKEDRLKLFNKSLASCSAVVNKRKSTKFKIISECENLINLDWRFDKHSLNVWYSSFPHETELDINKSKYNKLLTRSEVLEHSAWITAVEEDMNLLKTYRNIIFLERPGEKLMGFWILNFNNKSELTNLVLNKLDYHSSALGSSSLNYTTRLIKINKK